VPRPFPLRSRTGVERPGSNPGSSIFWLAEIEQVTSPHTHCPHLQ
jgi:hypothetical protein